MKEARKIKEMKEKVDKLKKIKQDKIDFYERRLKVEIDRENEINK